MNRSLLISLAGGLVAIASIFATLPDEAEVGMSTWLVAIVIVGVAGAAAHRLGDAGGGEGGGEVIEALRSC